MRSLWFCHWFEWFAHDVLRILFASIISICFMYVCKRAYILFFTVQMRNTSCKSFMLNTRTTAVRSSLHLLLHVRTRVYVFYFNVIISRSHLQCHGFKSQNVCEKYYNNACVSPPKRYFDKYRAEETIAVYNIFNVLIIMIFIFISELFWWISLLILLSMLSRICYEPQAIELTYCVTARYRSSRNGIMSYV